ncbi:MAG: hypothetical protein KA186_06870 [Flavobacteriales bacterium]|nr:hypothetical protein [Flavobacteriales bacterium]
MFRSSLILVCLLPFYSFAQSSVEGSGRASDAGQQVFEQRAATASPEDRGKVYKRGQVDVKPSYPGGDAALQDHLLNGEGCGVLPRMEDCFGSSNMNFDFVVNVDGTVGNVEFAKEGCPVLQSVVLCTLRGLEKWTPGMLNGKPVRVRLHQAVKFDLR